jgi:hypothetical protein
VRSAYTTQSVGTAEAGGNVISNVSVADVTVNEAAGTATFTAALDVAVLYDNVVSYATVDGTAKAGTDYTATSGTLVIPAYQQSATVTVPIAPDALYEGTESFSLQLSNPVDLGITDGSATAAIVDDDPLPVVSAGDASVEEGDSGQRPVSFPVTLSAPSGLPASVSWTLSYGTASSSDVTLASGSVTIPAGSTSATVAALVAGDTTKEADETFTVTLSAPVRALLGRAAGTGTIHDDDRKNALRVSIGNASVVEGALGTRRLVFTVSLSSASSSVVTVSYATSPGTATSADFTATSGQISIPAGALSATVAVDVRGDGTVEPDETFAVVLSAASGATINRVTGTGTIRNDD